MDAMYLIPEKEVLLKLNISRGTFNKLKKTNKFTYYRFNGRSYRYNLAEIIEALAVKGGEPCK